MVTNIFSHFILQLKTLWKLYVIIVPRLSMFEKETQPTYHSDMLYWYVFSTVRYQHFISYTKNEKNTTVFYCGLFFIPLWTMDFRSKFTALLFSFKLETTTICILFLALSWSLQVANDIQLVNQESSLVTNWSITIFKAW